MPDGPTVFDFAEVFASATVERETSSITFGTAAAREHLRGGWSIDEATSSGRPFVWSDGDESSLEFFLMQPRELTLTMRCEPLARPGAPQQVVDLLVNGRRIQEIRLEPGLHDYQARLPAEALVAGTNRLRFRYAHAEAPGGGSADTRRLAVAWYELAFGAAGNGSVSDSSVTVEAGGLRLPVGSQLAYHLRLPRGASLAFESVDLGSLRRAVLVVLLRPDGEPEREIARIGRSTGAWGISLAGDAGKTVRISLRALAGRWSMGSGSVRLKGAVLRGGVSPPPSAAPARPSMRRPHVLVYLVDALRADHLGCYGYPRPVSPHVDAFADEATVYRGFAPSSWTKASVASLLTGRLPIFHRAQDRGDVLPADALTLSELMADAGYRTYALSANTWISDTFGFDQGFEEQHVLHARSDRLTRELAARLRRLRPEDRLFAYVHTIDPHTPYEPTPEYRRRFAPAAGILTDVSALWLEDVAYKGRRTGLTRPRLVEEITALYDAEIAFNDRQFGLVLEELKRQGLYDDSLVVFTADHGEEFFEHGGVTHGRTLYREVLEVPLIVKWPRGVPAPPGASGSRAQLLDLLPTVLELVGVPAPPGLQGRSLLRSAPGEAPPSGDGFLSFLDLDGRTLQGVTQGRWKLVRTGPLDEPPRGLALYDLEDGGESADVQWRHPIVAAHLAGQIQAVAARRPRTSPPQAVVPDEAVERLKALGYLR